MNPISARPHIGINLHRNEAVAATDERALFGFWAFMMSDLVVFVLLFATFAVMRHGTAAAPGPQDIFSLPITALETACLLLSSFTFSLAGQATKLKQRSAAIAWMALTGLLGATFVATELYEFHDAFSKGGHPSASGFLSAWFTLVATHGLHVSIGLGWMAVTAFQVWRLGFREDIERRVLYLGVFWHLLDVVWVGIFSVVYLSSLA